jgi:glycine/D-amino acid oxidase-like deaminating enzyme
MGAEPSLPTRTDVVIIGGGIMGASAAFFLTTETDLEVTVVEKDNIASGSTGDSSALIRHHYGPKRVYSEMVKRAHDFFRSFEERTGEEIAYAEAPRVRFEREDGETADYARAGYELLQELDLPVKWYDEAEMEETWPQLELDEYDFAVSDESAAYSDAADVAGGFVRAAQRQGATVVTGVEVTDIGTEDGYVEYVETTDGTVQCDDVVIAAGPWTKPLAATVGVEVPITVSREQIVILEPSEEYVREYPDLIPMTGLPGNEAYTRPDFSDGILVATHFTSKSVDPDTYKKSPDEEVVLELTDTLLQLVPGLRDAGIRGQYCGVYSNTPDYDFVIDQVGPEGCTIACGFSGHGFKHAPVIGEILTDLVTTGETDVVDLEFFALDRFDSGGHSTGQIPD